MNTLIYSITGIIALIAISAFFSYLGTRKNIKIAHRIALLRKASKLAPDNLLFTPHKPGAKFLPLTKKAHNWRLDGLGPYGANSANR